MTGTHSVSHSTAEEYNKSAFAKIPSVDRLLKAIKPDFPQVKEKYLKRLIQTEITSIRENPGAYPLEQNDKNTFLSHLNKQLTRQLSALLDGTLKPAVNATGVILHTGLGRAPINPALAGRVSATSRYSNLEINLQDGRRGNRDSHIAPLLKILSGAEDGLAVNNNAAAVMLMLNTAGYQREIILSRGEMIEIGGSFRMPEVMKMSGCRLREIGTTNKTHLDDYKNAINEETGAILICHPSNYELRGFTQKPSLQDIVNLAHKNNLPLLYDLGSGSLLPARTFGADSEPEVEAIVEQGVDLISFSGDKLLGGPQAGLLVGDREWVQRCRRNQLLRAIRLDKFIIKLLQEALLAYLRTNSELPALDGIEALTTPAEQLKKRCNAFIDDLPTALQSIMAIKPAQGKVGSGAYPTMPLPGFAVKVVSHKIAAARLAGRLRTWKHPVFTYVEEDAVWIDLRTVSADEETIIKEALIDLLND